MISHSYNSQYNVISAKESAFKNSFIKELESDTPTNERPKENYVIVP